MFSLLQIKDTIYLESVICHSCDLNVVALYKFRERCIKYNNVFLKLLKSKEKEKEKSTNPSEDNSHVIEIDDDASSLGDRDNISVEQIESDEDNPSPPPVTNNTVNPSNEPNKEIQINGSKPNLTVEQRKAIYQASLSPCDICGKMTEKALMEGHINQHNGVQPYVCDIKDCGKKFYCRFSLSRHKRYYHSNAEYSCDICGKKFTNKRLTYGHKKVHLEPRFKCNICGQKFKNSSGLKSHLRIHTGEKPYACKLCDVAYSYNCLLKSHTKRCHPTATVSNKT